MNDIIFNKGQGGLGRPLPGEDHISGMLFFLADGNLPTGFLTTDRVKKVFSIAQAEALGITFDHIGATQAFDIVTMNTAGAEGDTITFVFNGVTLGAITVGASPTAGNNASDMVDAINALTYTTGFEAVLDGTDVVVLAPLGTGATYNGEEVTFVITGTPTMNNVAFTGGVGSYMDLLWYQVNEYFRIQPKGVLYIGIYEPAVTFTTEIVAIQTYANGEIRQMGVYVTATDFSTTHVSAMQSQANALAAVHKPLNIIYGANTTDWGTITDLPTLRTLDCPNVSVVVGMDGAAVGNDLYLATGKSVPCLGTTLGAISLSKVMENIGWVAKFNVSTTEFATIKFSNGNLYTSIPDSGLNSLDIYGYIFLRKHIGIAGAYFNDSSTAIVTTSDYAYIENNRTIDKAIRNIRTNVLPQLNSPITVNADGTLTNDVIAYFQELAGSATEQMAKDGELSAQQVIIDPTQDVLTSSTLIITVVLVPVGVARHIVINIGFTTSIA